MLPTVDKQLLHNHKDFPDLLNILEVDTGVLAALVEKDYWIMHVLYGLQILGLSFELKGGTSLSKAFQLIQRFSEDIDIYIHPPEELGINENPKNTSKKTVEDRKNYYNWLKENIAIDGIISVERDEAFDDLEYYRSGGIRLHYKSVTSPAPGLKEGVLLEVGFDNVAPNTPITITSWAYDRAAQTPNLELVDNRAKDVRCYHPGYTFVEKLQTIATKYRSEQEGSTDHPNFMRQYYDVYSLLASPIVQAFIGTPEYEAHKQKRFPQPDRQKPIRENEAFLLNDPKIRADFERRYKDTAALYYNSQPPFGQLLERIKENIERL